MNIVIVSDYGVDVFKKWSDAFKVHNVTKEDFVRYEKDYILYFDKEAHQVSKDIKLIEQVATAKIFPKPKMTMPEMMSIGSFFILIMLLMGGM